MSERAMQIFEDYKAAMVDAKQIMDLAIHGIKAKYGEDLTIIEKEKITEMLKEYLEEETNPFFAQAITDAAFASIVPKLGETGTLVMGPSSLGGMPLEINELSEDELTECQMRENVSHIMENLSPEGYKEALEYYKRVSALSEDKRKELAHRINEYTKQAVAELEGE